MRDASVTGKILLNQDSGKSIPTVGVIDKSKSKLRNSRSSAPKMTLVSKK